MSVVGSKIIAGLREALEWARGRGDVRITRMDGMWVTYRIAAEHLGISPEAVRQRAIRGTLKRRHDVNGRALVLLPSNREASR